MGSRPELKAQDWEFVELVNRAIFANPFSDDRIEIDLKISGLPRTTPRIKRVDTTITVVNAWIQGLKAKGIISIKGLGAEKRDLLGNVFLFDVFHRYLHRFDRLILDQIEAGHRPIRVDFAPDALAALAGYGFKHEEALRYFALCYQLRRAFYFIDRSLVGNSACMKELRRNLWNNVFTHNIRLYNQYLLSRMEDFSTLILGETGTGKGAAAGSIGRSGFIPFDESRLCFTESFTQSFMSLNLSQFPEALIESELFGHKKGAFTGAVEDHKGVFSRCSPFGAIFLDEIGDVSIPIQIKLLQVLQERLFCPVGSHRQQRFEGRVIAATNRSIQDMRRSGEFRDDFFYRLCSDIIVVPTLRQRIQQDPTELRDLLAHTIEHMVGVPSKELAQMALQVIQSQLGKDYPWPGNVRELEQCVRRILLKKSYEGDIRTAGVDICSRLAEDISNGGIDAKSLIAGYCCLLYKRHGTFEEVAKRTALDRRTVKRHVQFWLEHSTDE